MMKYHSTILLVMISAVIGICSCQTDERRSQEKVEVWNRAHKKMQEIIEQNNKPEVKAAQQKERKDKQCAIMWDHDREVQNRIGTAVFMKTRFFCKNGQLCEETVMFPNTEDEKKTVRVWTVGKIRKECPDCWKSKGNPCGE